MDTRYSTKNEENIICEEYVSAAETDHRVEGLTYHGSSHFHVFRRGCRDQLNQRREVVCLNSFLSISNARETVSQSKLFNDDESGDV